MKKILLPLLLLISFFASAQRAEVAGWNETKFDIIKGSGTFYLPGMVRLPSDYFQPAGLTKRYPVIFMFHGTGQAGTDSIKVLTDGWPKNLSNNGSTTYTHEGAPVTVGTDSPTANDKNGNSREGIVIVIQHSSYSFDPLYFAGLFEEVSKRWRMDSSMVYLYGFSAGNRSGTGAISNATDTSINRFITAIIINSGATQDLTIPGIKKVADRGIHALLVVGSTDISYRDQMRMERDSINNNSNPDLALYEEVSGQGHSGFDANALNSKTWTVTSSKNFVQWAFQYANPYATTWTPSSGTLVANAGVDQTIYMPKTSVTLSGGGSSGSIVSVLWTKLSNGTKPQEGAILSPTSLNTTANNIGTGIYKYELTLYDGTTTKKDTVVITVYNQKSPIPNANHEKFLLTPSSSGYFYQNIINTLPTLNGGDTIVLTQNTTQVSQFYGDDGSGGWGGDSLNPVVIINPAGSQIVLGGAFRCNGRYIKITGSGDANIKYGFKLTGSAESGFVFPVGHEHIEVERCNMVGGNNGIYAKAVVDTLNVLSYGHNWIFEGNHFHDCKIENTNGEGMYLNHTFSDEPYSGAFTYYTPLKMNHLWVNRDSLIVCGWDGIQTSNADSAIIEDNFVSITGGANKSSQLFGIIVGGYNKKAIVRNNHVEYSKSAGIFIAGYDTIRVTNNFIDTCGYSDIQVDGNANSGNPFTAIYCNDNQIPSLGAPSPGLLTIITGNCIQRVSSYANGAAIESRNGHGTGRAGTISSNQIRDALNRNANTVLIKSAVSGEVISGNTLATCPNPAPVANAGTDQLITLPTSTGTLDATASQNATSYLWTKVSGPATYTITSATSASTTATGLVMGVYIFQVLVNGVVSAQVTITVNAPPTASAGTDQVINLPSTSVTLDGTGSSDADGTIVTYQWTKVSGTGGVIVSATTPSTNVTGLSAGSYSYELAVTDNNGSTKKDTVSVIVNIAPTATISRNTISVVSPKDTAHLISVGADADGTIATYLWTKVSGPSGGSISTPALDTTIITGLNIGDYVYRITVTDNRGATGSATATISVTSSTPAVQRNYFRIKLQIEKKN